MAKVFITGVAGFLGSHLAEALLRRGHEVRGCDDLSGGSLENIPEGVEFFEFDVRNQTECLRATRGSEVVFHMAAAAYEGLSVFSPHFVSESVIGCTTSILSASIQNRVRRFVYCSSMSRYGVQPSPFFEEMVPRPQTPYGIAKYSSELLVRNLCETHGIEHFICVPHSIIGPKQKFDDPYRNVAAIMANRMLMGKQPIIYGEGNQKRCFSFVSDCIQVLEQLVDTKVGLGEVLNIGPDEEFVSILELAKTIAGLLNFTLDPIFVPARPQEVLYANCSAEKIRRLYDYDTRVGLKEGLTLMVDWIQKVGPKPFVYKIPIEIQTSLVPKTWVEHLI